MERRQDIVLGAVFAALGLFAAVKATAYSGATGAYPMALSLVLVAFGVLVAVKAALRGQSVPRPLTENTGRALLTFGLGAVYLALVPLLGFYTASALVVLALPLSLGFRQPLFLVAVTVIFVTVVWVVFSLVLEKPLPTEFWQDY